MTYDCMTADELALWREGAAMVARQTGYETRKPCADCPLWFASQARAAGCCIGRPQTNPRRGSRGPTPTYATPQERAAARRDSWRKSKRRSRGEPPSIASSSTPKIAA